MRRNAVIPALCILLLLTIGPNACAKPTASQFHLLYIYSDSCPPCTTTTPIVKKMSRDFPVRGLYFGETPPGKIPFDVQQGEKKIMEQYGLEGVPDLVVLENEGTKAVFQGEAEIRDANIMLHAFTRGASTVSEAVTQRDSTADIMVTGWLVNKGGYFKNARFLITDRRVDLAVKPWLPLEAVNSPFRKTYPRRMSDVVNKPVVLRGRIEKKGNALEFVVAEELLLDTL